MMTPTIHLNGTSKEELLRQLWGAQGDLGRAIESLSMAAPHGRDYYPQGQDAIGQATQEHLSRMSRLRSVQQELEAMLQELL